MILTDDVFELSQIQSLSIDQFLTHIYVELKIVKKSVVLAQKHLTLEAELNRHVSSWFLTSSSAIAERLHDASCH